MESRDLGIGFIEKLAQTQLNLQLDLMLHVTLSRMDTLWCVQKSREFGRCSTVLVVHLGFGVVSGLDLSEKIAKAMHRGQ